MPAIPVSQADLSVAGSASKLFASHFPADLWILGVQRRTGEAYLVEVVQTDITPPNQLPEPTQNVTYDPYYVRVVFSTR